MCCNFTPLFFEMKRFQQLLAAVGITLSVASCMPSPYYQQSYSVPGSAWGYNFAPGFRFELPDTSANYDTYFIIRHTKAYPYSNIWVKLNVKRPGDSTFNSVRLELPLTAPSGQFGGRHMGEIYEQRCQFTLDQIIGISKQANSILDQKLVVSVQGKPVMSQKGIYEIKIEQDMRENPLPEVLQVGLRIERRGIVDKH